MPTCSRIVFFDVDGVLVASPRRFSDRLATEYRISPEILQPFFVGPFKDCGLGKADLKEELQKVLGDWGWKGTVEELMAFWFSKGTEFDPKVLAIAKNLKTQGAQLFIVSHQERYRGEVIREAVGKGNPFEEVFTSGEMGLAKKSREFFEQVFSIVDPDRKTPYEEMLMIDDDQGVIDLTKELGMSTHLYTKPEALLAFLNI